MIARRPRCPAHGRGGDRRARPDRTDDHHIDRFRLGTHLDGDLADRGTGGVLPLPRPTRGRCRRQCPGRRSAARQWFHRLGRLAPTLRLTVTDVWATGLPHNTVITARWTATQTMLDGSPYANHGVHIIRMSCRKITEIDANEDSQAVADSMSILTAHGVAEATAEPITT